MPPFELFSHHHSPGAGRKIDRSAFESPSKSKSVRIGTTGASPSILMTMNWMPVSPAITMRPVLSIADA
ncbi:MAG: hypothetical protein IPK01_13290 [Acidobacteria bacterium]|nr:hypothetical protein [Acidobacteriota bacterium]